MKMWARAVAPLLVALSAAACGSNAGPTSATDTPAPPSGVYEIRGSIVAVDRAREIVEIDHEAIPGVMPAMTMPYEVAGPAVLEGIAVGDHVRGSLRVDSRGMIITSLQRL
jgi:Cu/Ag efflux protein CusF